MWREGDWCYGKDEQRRVKQGGFGVEDFSISATMILKYKGRMSIVRDS